MRLAARITLVHLAILAVMLTLYGALSVYREQALFDEDIVRDNRALAAGVALALQDDTGGGTLSESLSLAEGHVQLQVIAADQLARRATPQQVSALAASGEFSFFDPVTHEHVTWRTVDKDPGGRVVQVSGVADIERAFVRESALHAAWVFGLLLAMVGTSAGVTGWWFVGRPIAALSRHADAVGAGELSRRLGWVRKDELGDLAGATDRMSERLRVLISNLELETASRANAEAQLRHADRLATVGTLAAGIAHELGTPLNVIALRAEMIRTNADATPPVRDGARVIEEQAERITSIIKQLLKFARPTKAKIASFDPVELLAEVAELLGPAAGKKQCRVSVSGDAVKARGDRSLLLQALLNLVMNALHASPVGGTVELSVDRVPAARPDDPSAASRPWVRLSVRDNGPGVPADIRDHLFEPFFTTKAPGEGTGLGLSVTWGIVQEHEGFLAVEDAQPGARFAIYLPDLENG